MSIMIPTIFRRRRALLSKLLKVAPFIYLVYFCVDSFSGSSDASVEVESKSIYSTAHHELPDNPDVNNDNQKENGGKEAGKADVNPAVAKMAVGEEDEDEDDADAEYHKVSLGLSYVM